MSSHESDILDAVVAALAGMTGWSSSKVQIGIPTPGDVKPTSAWVSPGGTVSGRQEADLGGFRRGMLLDVLIAVPAASSTASARVKAALDVSALARRALEANVTLSSNVLDMEVKFEQVSGDEMGVPGLGLALGEVSVWWLSMAGEE